MVPTGQVHRAARFCRAAMGSMPMGNLLHMTSQVRAQRHVAAKRLLFAMLVTGVVSGQASAQTLPQSIAPAIIQPTAPTGSVTPPPTLVPPQSALVAGPAGQATPLPAFDLVRTLDAAREVVHRYKESLKGQLQSALKSDGPANAISLCQTITPDLVTEIADTLSFEVGRTALKLRNPENAPGPWELEVLRQFQAMAASGKDADKLEQHTIVTTAEGDRVFRYMRGIKTGEMCLSCHGSDLRPDVKAELVRYYPDDKATGFRAGELRGAFVVQKLIGE